VPHTDEEELAFQMLERGRVQKAKEDVQNGLHNAGADVFRYFLKERAREGERNEIEILCYRYTEAAEHDLEEGLIKATRDLYAGIEEARQEGLLCWLCWLCLFVCFSFLFFLFFFFKKAIFTTPRRIFFVKRVALPWTFSRFRTDSFMFWLVPKF
jgi:hypothetical protein